MGDTTLKERALKQIHHQLHCIFEDLRDLLYEVGKHNPGIESDHKKPIPVLAQDMGTMVTRMNILRVDILALHKKRESDNT